MMILAKRCKGPEIAFQAFLYPVTDAGFNINLYQALTDGPWLTRETMQWFWSAYAPEELQRRDIIASSFRSTVEDLKYFQAALIVTSENYILWDDGELYVRKLIEAGIFVASVHTVDHFMILWSLILWLILFRKRRISTILRGIKKSVALSQASIFKKYICSIIIFLLLRNL